MRSKRSIATALRKQLRAAVPTGTTVDSLIAAGGVTAALTRALDREVTDPLRDAVYAGMVEATALGVARVEGETNAAHGVKADMAFDVDWDLVNEGARAWVWQYSGQLIDGLNATSASVLRTALSNWINNSLSYSQLLREVGNAFGDARAGLIATTEITRAYAQATIQAYRQSGIVTKVVWQTANDEMVCDICGPLQDTVVGVEAPDFPYETKDGKSGTIEDGPPAHPRCRCWLTGDVQYETPQYMMGESSVSDSLSGSDKTGVFDHVLGLVDKTHGTGKVVPTQIKWVSTDKYWGVYNHKAILISRSAAMPNLALSHEIGHWLDGTAFGLKFGSASMEAANHNGGPLVGWWSAVKQSSLYERLTAKAATSKYCAYMADPQELWARSYAQWLAVKTGDTTLINEINTGNAPYKLWQWGASDFTPIYNEIDKLMKAMGFL